MTSSKGKMQPTYDEAFKARAVARLMAEGWPNTRGALTKVARELDMTHVTLRAWAKGKSGAPDPEHVRLTVDTMVGALDGKLQLILDEMDEKSQKASFRDLSVAFGILFDKRQLLVGAPTSRTESIATDLRRRSNKELDEIVLKAKTRANKDLEQIGLKSNSGGSGDSAPSISK